MSSNSATKGTFLGRLNKGLIPIEDAANLLAAFAIMAMMLLGVTQVVMRTVFNNPISGYIDLVELSMASMAFLGAAYTQRMGSHIRMELLMSRLSGRPLWALEALGAALAMFIIGVLVYYSYGHFLRALTLGDTTIDAEYPTWPSKLLVPIAFSIWWCRLAIQFLGAVRLAIFPNAEPVGVVVIKNVAEQAQDEIHEVMGDDLDLSAPGENS